MPTPEEIAGTILEWGTDTTDIVARIVQAIREAEDRGTANVDRAKLAKVEAERDEADRRAGAAERRKVDLEVAEIRHRQWLDDAKRAAGYHPNVSFDVVWADALAALKEKRDREANR